MSISFELPSMKRLRIHDSDQEDEFEEPRRKKRPVLQPHLPINVELDPIPAILMNHEDMITDTHTMPNSLIPSSQHFSQSNGKLKCQLYSDYQQERLRSTIASLQQDPSQSFVIDLLDLLDHGVAKCQYLAESDVLDLLKLAKMLHSSRAVNKLHCILRQDLRGRQNLTFSSQMMDELNTYLNDCLQLLRERQSSEQSLHTLQLTLNYFVKALTNPSGGNLRCISSRLAKWTFFSKLVWLIFAVIDADNFLHQFIIRDNLLNDLFMLLSIPLSVEPSQEVTQRISFNFEEQLREINSLSKRRYILQLIPLDELKERVIDIHLEKEFKFHSSNAVMLGGIQEGPVNLSKFCCVHLCRMPYRHNGSLHDLSYFLHLLHSLLETHLLLTVGVRPALVSWPSSKPKRKVPNDFLSVLGSVKPHIAGLVDRLSEDQVLLTQLVSPPCWTDIQQLSGIIDNVIASLS